MTTTHNYEVRYAANWQNIANFTKSLTQGKCVCCGKPATEVHHARYSINGEPIAGKEQPLVDVFPLCDAHHSEAHLKQNWVTDLGNPVLGNRNTPEYYQHLLRCAEPYKPKPQREYKPIIPVVLDDWEPYQEPEEGFNFLNLIYALPFLLLIFLL